MIAIAADCSVGVDLEHLRAQSDYAEIARCFFSAAEVDRLTALPSHLYAEAFIGCWTKKEAYLKARGDGLAVPLNSFSVPVKHWSFHTLRPAAGYIGALAIEGRGWRLRQRRWTEIRASNERLPRPDSGIPWRADEGIGVASLGLWE